MERATAAIMAMQKTKTVSFRVSDREFRRMQEARSAMGLRSVSELARCATQRFIDNPQLGSVEQELLDLRARVQGLTTDLHELERRVLAAPAQ